MTRCASESDHPAQGLAWTDPDPLKLSTQTERTLIRPYRSDDVDAVFEAVELSRGALLPWMPWARVSGDRKAATMTYVAAQATLATGPLKPEGVGVGIFERDSGAFLGSTGFHDLRRETASVETGYWIRADRHREGLCTEAMRGWITHMLRPKPSGGLGLNRVRIYCSADNLPSQQIPRKLGFRHEVHQRADYYVPEHGITDRLGWGVLAEEWNASERDHRA
ncbi:MAG: GNAT family N-acetyltransferase [Phycisphaerales bacterium]